jgi:radical SAM superfamily enzyme YgiQ (UPF0313 family)
MMHVLLLSFDLLDSNEPQIPYSTAALNAYVKRNINHTEFKLDAASINLMNLEREMLSDAQVIDQWLKVFQKKYDWVGIACNIWSEIHVHQVMDYLRCETSSKIVLGGPSITQNKIVMEKKYPLADCFISGHAENSLVFLINKAIANDGVPNWLNMPFDQKIIDLPSPYLTDDLLSINKGDKVRMETLRGCAFRCSFCAHRNATQNSQLLVASDQTVLESFKLFENKKVDRINMLDPYFNWGDHGVRILKLAKMAGLTRRLNLQVRPDVLVRQKEFLELAKELNVCLEIGVQSMDADVLRNINRGSGIDKVQSALELVIAMGIKFEITLIYGLPGQTVKSLRNTIDLLSEIGVQNIQCFPLELLPNTLLEDHVGKYRIKTQFNKYGIQLVTESYSFDLPEYRKMEEIAIKCNAVDSISGLIAEKKALNLAELDMDKNVILSNRC